MNFSYGRSLAEKNLKGSGLSIGKKERIHNSSSLRESSDEIILKGVVLLITKEGEGTTHDFARPLAEGILKGSVRSLTEEEQRHGS